MVLADDLSPDLTPEPAADPAAAPVVDPWASDSDRAATVETPAPPDSPDTPPDSPDTPVSIDTRARDEAGKFAPAEPAKDGKKPRTDPAARVAQATAKEAIAKDEARQAREEAQQLRQRLAALEGGKPPTAPVTRPTVPARPAFPDFGAWAEAHPDQTYEDYTDARTDARFASLTAQREQAQRTESRVSAHTERLQQTIATDPDYAAALPTWDAALAAVGVHNRPGGLPIPAVMEQAILDSPEGPALMRYLGTHPQEARQLVQESADVDASPAAVRVMRRLLETTARAVQPALDSAPAVRPSSAKPPINRVGGTASATPVPVDDLEFGPEYIRAMNKIDAAKGGGRW